MEDAREEPQRRATLNQAMKKAFQALKMGRPVGADRQSGNVLCMTVCLDEWMNLSSSPGTWSIHSKTDAHDNVNCPIAPALWSQTSHRAHALRYDWPTGSYHSSMQYILDWQWPFSTHAITRSQRGQRPPSTNWHEIGELSNYDLLFVRVRSSQDQIRKDNKENL